jgi:hypothetical protein
MHQCEDLPGFGSGTIDENNTMHGNGTHVGPLTLRRRLARLIADDPELAD